MATHFRWLITDSLCTSYACFLCYMWINWVLQELGYVSQMCIYCALLNWEVCWFFSPIFRKSYLDLIISCWLYFSFTFYFFSLFFFFFWWGCVCVYVCVMVMVCFFTLLLSSNHVASYMLNFELGFRPNVVCN